MRSGTSRPRARVTLPRGAITHSRDAGRRDRRLCRPCDCADLRCESVVLQGVRPRQVGTITTRRQGSAGFRSRVAGWTWIGATERGEGRRDSNSPVYTPKQPATRSVATLVLGRGAGSASLARRWQTSGRATGLCRPTGGGSLNPQAIQPQGRHNQKVGTITIVPTSAQRRIGAQHRPWRTKRCPPLCVRLAQVLVCVRGRAAGPLAALAGCMGTTLVTRRVGEEVLGL